MKTTLVISNSRFVSQARCYCQISNNIKSRSVVSVICFVMLSDAINNYVLDFEPKQTLVQNIYSTGATLYNNLPQWIKDSISIKTFKKILGNYF